MHTHDYILSYEELLCGRPQLCTNFQYAFGAHLSNILAVKSQYLCLPSYQPLLFLGEEERELLLLEDRLRPRRLRRLS